MTRSLLLCCLWVLGAVAPVSAAERQPVAFATLVKDGSEKPLGALLATDHAKQLARHGFHDVQFYTEKIGGRRVLLCMADLDADHKPAASWNEARQDAALAAWWTACDANLTPHPRAAAGTPWVLCETIAKVRSDVPAALRGNSPSWHASATGLRKEREVDYRLLHNKVWPGVVDAIGESGIDRFDVFLIELDDQLYLFSLFEFIGKDFAKDTGAMARNPVNQRWWKATDPCQEPLPAAAARKEVWDPMSPAADLAK